MHVHPFIVFVFLTFRDLPSPLLTREHLQTFTSIADIELLKEQVRSLNLLVLLLPEVNQMVLKVCEVVRGRLVSFDACITLYF